MKLAIATAVGLAMAASANAQTFDLSGIQVDGANGTVMVGSVTSSVAVTAIEFDIQYDAGGINDVSGSWGSELNIDIVGPDNTLTADGSDDDFSDDGPDDILFGWDDAPGVYSFTMTVPFSGSAGTYDFSVAEDFDDAGLDGEFLSGSTITLVPTPGSAAILGLGGLAAVRRRR